MAQSVFRTYRLASGPAVDLRPRPGISHPTLSVPERELLIRRISTVDGVDPREARLQVAEFRSDRRSELRHRDKLGGSLFEVLGQNEHVRGIVEECAEELSSVNVVLKDELAKPHPLPEVKKALEKSEGVETKVLAASEKLSVVNQALEAEVKGRHALEEHLAVVMEQEEAARHAAIHDPLTGLPNRLLFYDRLEHGLAQATRHGWKLAVMFVDLDDFKRVNDSYGHDVGDVVLRTIAGRLKESVRGDDTVSRHGGDEFLYLMMEIRDEQDAATIADKIANAIQAPVDVTIGDRIIPAIVYASIGISIFPKNGTTASSLVKSADEAMYRAKSTKGSHSFAG